MNLNANRAPALAALVLACLAATPIRAGAQTVFFTDFESGLPAEFTALGSAIEVVQGYAGLGTAGNQFGGSFLRYTSTGIQETRLTLLGLPPHDKLSLSFLLALIDSWDGERFDVSVDGNLVFSHTFQLAVGASSSYLPPPGGLLATAALGWTSGGFWNNDRAYDMSIEPVFQDLPHTGGSVTIVWKAVSPPGAWQGGADESWAIENVKVSVSSSPTAAAGASWGRMKALYR